MRARPHPILIQHELFNLYVKDNEAVCFYDLHPYLNRVSRNIMIRLSVHLFEREGFLRECLGHSYLEDVDVRYLSVNLYNYDRCVLELIRLGFKKRLDLIKIYKMSQELMK